MTIVFAPPPYPSLGLFPGASLYPSEESSYYVRTKLAVQRIVPTSTTVAFAAPDAGQDAVLADTVLEVRNVTGSPSSFSLVDGVADGGWPVEDAVFTVPGNGEVRVLLGRRPFIQRSGDYIGRVLVDYADPAAVVRACTRTW